MTAGLLLAAALAAAAPLAVWLGSGRPARTRPPAGAPDDAWGLPWGPYAAA
jgi:hypothetical protein